MGINNNLQILFQLMIFVFVLLHISIATLYVHRYPSQEGGAFLFSQKKTPWRYRGLIRRIRLKQTKFLGDGDDIRQEQRIVREAVTSFSPSPHSPPLSIHPSSANNNNAGQQMSMSVIICSSENIYLNNILCSSVFIL